MTTVSRTLGKTAPTPTDAQLEAAREWLKENYNQGWLHGPKVESLAALLAAREAAARAEQNEACARECEAERERILAFHKNFSEPSENACGGVETANDLAARIRARQPEETPR